MVALSLGNFLLKEKKKIMPDLKESGTIKAIVNLATK
jgi:hypothetical protein